MTLAVVPQPDPNVEPGAQPQPEPTPQPTPQPGAAPAPGQTPLQAAQHQAAELGLTKADLAELGITTPEMLAAFKRKVPEVFDFYNKAVETRSKQRQQQQKQTAKSETARIIKNAMREHQEAGGDPADFLADFLDTSTQISREEAAAAAKEILHTEKQVAHANKAAHDKFWSDPNNADLIESRGWMITFVEEDGMSPAKAAARIRATGLKDTDALKRKYGGGGLGSPHYEGNRDDPGRHGTAEDPKIKTLKDRLSESRKKPEGQRGGRAMFDIFSKDAPWGRK